MRFVKNSVTQLFFLSVCREARVACVDDVTEMMVTEQPLDSRDQLIKR